MPIRDLIDRYREDRQLCEAQAQELAQRREALLSSAERDAQVIVASARGEIRRVLVGARRELLELATQVSEIEGRPAPSTDTIHARILGMRRELNGVVTDARPDLEAMAPQAPVPSVADADVLIAEPAAVGESEPHSSVSRLGRALVVILTVAAVATVVRTLQLILAPVAVPAAQAVTAVSSSPVARAEPVPAVDGKARVQPAAANATRSVRSTDARPAAAVAATTGTFANVASEPGATGSSDPAAAGALTSAGVRWLDAYYRGDAETLRTIAAGDAKVSDSRSGAERPPAGLDHLQRVLDSVSAQSAGIATLWTARMKEQTSTPGAATAYSSWVSLLWIHEPAGLRLAEVRLLSDAKLQPRR